MDVIAVEDLLQDPNSGLDDNRAGGTRLPDLLFGRADAAVGDAADTADVSDGGNTMELVSYFLAVEQERMQVRAIAMNIYISGSSSGSCCEREIGHIENEDPGSR